MLTTTPTEEDADFELGHGRGAALQAATSTLSSSESGLQNPLLRRVRRKEVPCAGS
jgi:hypothetical protein